MLSDPKVTVECDECGYEEEFGMTPLARGSWDCRDLVKEIERAGWILPNPNDDDYHLCPDCVEEELSVQPAQLPMLGDIYFS